MQIKYLTLAMTAALALNLTACGSDKDEATDKVDDHSGHQHEEEMTEAEKAAADAAAAEAEAAAAEAAAAAALAAEEQAAADAAAAAAAAAANPSSTVEPENNHKDASKGGDLSEITTGTQHYVRAKVSSFDTINNPKDVDAEKSTSLVTNFDKLVNTEMANIVVGRNAADRDEASITFAIGTTDNDYDRADALQTYNEQYVDGATMHAITNTGKNNGLLYVPIFNSASQSVVGQEENLVDSRSRFFGANWVSSDVNVLADGTEGPGHYNAWKFTDNQIAKSSAVPLYDNTSGTNVRTPYYQDFYGADHFESILATSAHLRNVQFGRVTANLDNLDDFTMPNASASVVNINGRNYYMINPSDAYDANRFLNVGNNASTENDIDTYFYRGNNRTETMPSTGSATYYGQALMYGIDNSYHGQNTTTGGGQSNAVGQPTASVVDALGNFVRADVDFASGTVAGSVYNVWRKTDASLVRDDVVRFNGNIIGANTVSGEAELAYNTASKADFQAAFYGEQADEMGGSFNAVRKDGDKGTDGASSWGGVFGAESHQASSDGLSTE